MSIGGGSYGEFEAGLLDANAPLNRRGTVSGRVNLPYRQLGEFTDGLDPSEHILVAPALTISARAGCRNTPDQVHLAKRSVGRGAGFPVRDRREGDNSNSFAVPSYGLLDLALYYERSRFSGQVNVSNATNERYFSGASNRLLVNPGSPLSVSSRLAWSF